MNLLLFADNVTTKKEYYLKGAVIMPKVTEIHKIEFDNGSLLRFVKTNPSKNSDMEFGIFINDNYFVTTISSKDFLGLYNLIDNMIV